MKKQALITGATDRIGLEMAYALCKWGYDIIIHYCHSKNNAVEAKKVLKNKGVRCELVQCDFLNEKETAAFIKATFKKHGSIDLLINNASIFESAQLKNTNNDKFKRHFAVNCEAPFILSRDYYNYHKGKGHIINIIDSQIKFYKTKHSAYLLSKKSLEELTMLCALEFAPRFRVNAISPGAILPPKAMTKKQFLKIEKSTPLKIKSSAKYITQALEYLLSNAYITGENLYVDAGRKIK